MGEGTYNSRSAIRLGRTRLTQRNDLGCLEIAILDGGVHGLHELLLLPHLRSSNKGTRAYTVDRRGASLLRREGRTLRSQLPKPASPRADYSPMSVKAENARCKRDPTHFRGPIQ